MSLSTRRLLARIGRWPRRIAALLCLLLAAGSAVLPNTRAATGAAERGTAARLRSGEVAVPVPIGSAGAGDVRPGDLVGILAVPADSTASAALVADHLRVMAVRSGAALGGDTGSTLVIATDRARAVRLARYSSRPLVLIIDGVP